MRLVLADLWDPIELADVVAQGPEVLWLETPSNPLLRVIDIEHAARLGHAQGAVVVVDNTFVSPALQRPLNLGADVVVHSTTKYLNGHSDMVGGAVVAADEALHERLAWWANCLGVTGAPFDSFLTLRGLRTLHARMAWHLRNTEEIVRVLVDHPGVERVYWPGLPGHPGREIALRQQDGFGAVVTFDLAEDSDAQAFTRSLTHFSLAESLGGVESLVAHPATMTHASMSRSAQAAAGVGPRMFRISVGIEAPADLCRDLDRALTCATDTGFCVAQSAGVGRVLVEGTDSPSLRP